MLNSDDRFFSPSGDIYTGGPSIWHIMDWDQRRLIAVKMEGEVESPDAAIECLRKHIDNLAPDVVEIEVSLQGDLLATSSDPEKDDSYCMIYPPPATTNPPENIQVVSRQDLEEIDRLSPMVDLVKLRDSPEPDRKLVFKYYFLIQRMSFVWLEMNIWMRLPPHPHIVPFDKIVIDELEGGCVGFTVPYIPGGTLEENRNRVFKLKWLRQLTEVIDELNLNLGIAHQDVAPRNLLINEKTDSLMIFDFNFSAQIGEKWQQESRNDIKGLLFTMYELVTRDDTLRAVRHEDQHISDIEKDWKQHPEVELDHPVSDFREVLWEWVEKRRIGKRIETFKDAPNFIDWPGEPKPPPTEGTPDLPSDPLAQTYLVWFQRRNDLRKKGTPILNWQRPPQSSLRPGDRLRGTGEYISRVDTGERETGIEDEAGEKKAQFKSQVVDRKTKIDGDVGERETPREGEGGKKGAQAHANTRE